MYSLKIFILQIECHIFLANLSVESCMLRMNLVFAYMTFFYVNVTRVHGYKQNLK